MIAKTDFIGIPSRDAERSRAVLRRDARAASRRERAVRVLGRRHLLRHLGAGEARDGVRAAEERPPRAARGRRRRVPRGARGEGVEFAGEIMDTGVCHMAFFTDPDGNDDAPQPLRAPGRLSGWLGCKNRPYERRRVREGGCGPGCRGLGRGGAGQSPERDPARTALARGAAARPLRERDPDRRADGDRALHRRGRHEAAGRRGAGQVRHGRDRLRGDERQRRDLRRRRAAGDARLHRDRAGRSRGAATPIGVGLARGAELASVEIPGGSSPSSATWLRGFDVAGACFGTVALDEIVDGAGVAAGRRGDRPPLLRPALQRLHARPRGRSTGSPLDEDPEGRLRPAARRGAARADRDLRQAGPRAAAFRVEVRGLAHITSGGLGNLLASWPTSATRSRIRPRFPRSSP